MEDNVKEISEVTTPQSQAMFDIEKEHKKQKIQGIVKNVFVYAFLTICAVFAFLPFFWMFISSIKTEMEYRDPTGAFFPDKAMWINYTAVLKQTRS